jgi:hypothetical protein
VLPTLVRPVRHTLERGRRSPRKGDGRLSRARPGRRHDVGPVGHVSSVTISLVRPSPLPRHHPGHCSTIPDTMGIQDDKTLPRLPLCALRPPVSRTLESAYGRRPNRKSPLNRPRSRPCVGTGLTATPGRNEIARTAINSTTLYTIPLHVIRTVRHDCKLPPLGL